MYGNVRRIEEKRMGKRRQGGGEDKEREEEKKKKYGEGISRRRSGSMGGIEEGCW